MAKIRLYLSDWFYNMGLVGFKRILEYAKDYKNLNLELYGYKEQDNHIEFDSELLINFQDYYFEYFLYRYDMYRIQSEHIDKLIALTKKNDKFKEDLKLIKNLIKSDNDKIKKIDTQIYENANDIYKSIGNLKKKEQINELENLCNSYKGLLSIKKVNERMSLNKFKSIMSNIFFGQVSYLNVVNTSKSMDEQKQIMYKDYLNPIIEMCNINDYIHKKDIEGLKKYIEKALKESTINKNIAKIYNEINKDFLKRNKNIEDIKDYLNSDEFDVCSLCGDHKSLGNNYGEGNFVPLAVSMDNSRNMLWNMNTNYPICDICRLILFCSLAGAVDIFKGYMNTNLAYEDKVYYSFVNLDTSFKELYKVNENFSQKRGNENPFNELIFDIIATAKERSVWQLQNILYVEFNTEYNSKNCKMNYFNIPKYIAKFFKEKGELLKGIKDNVFRANIVDEIFNNRDLKLIIDKKLRKIIAGEFGNPVDCYKAVKVKYHLKRFKGGCIMGKPIDDKKLKFIYMRGIDLNTYYRNKKAENKINSIAYRLLNASKANNRKEFMDTLIRVHMSAEMEVPSIFLDVMLEKDLSFDEIAHAFISGLISKANIKNVSKGER